MSASRQTGGHAGDAGGDPATLEAKQSLREEIWDRLADEGVARFPGAHGRIPNFAGAAEAADRLQALDAWSGWQTMKANPDAAQWPVRQRAVAAGMTVYMAVPRLADEEPFLELDPALIDAPPRTATSIKGASRHGRPVAVEELRRVDVAVVGCVAVDAAGARLGKGGGFADLELALAQEAGMVDEGTIVATTIHPLQLVEPGRIPVTDHDVGVDLVVTPEGPWWCDRDRPRPSGVRWEELTEEKVAAIPLLARLREGRLR